MDQSNQLSQSKIDYYRNLLDSEESKKNLIFDIIADKLMGSMDIQVLDFSIENTKEVLINQIRSKSAILYLKKPINIIIEKKLEGGFVIVQNDLLLRIESKSFREAIRKFQDSFYVNYYKYLTNLTSNDKIVKELYLSIVNKEVKIDNEGSL